ncbi:MAG: hypothetical protein ABEK03_05685 [Candidatus Bipolaricaulia bacterium]
MSDYQWTQLVQREYHEADSHFIRDVLPMGSVDGSSFGLIADATHYRLVDEGEAVHIRPQVAELEGIIKSLGQGGMSVNAADAKASVHRFAEIWEERIRAANKWEQVLETARDADEIRQPDDDASANGTVEAGVLSRLKRRLFGE